MQPTLPTSEPRGTDILAESAVIIGMGQLGALFAEGWLRSGRGVLPRVRGQSASELEAVLPHPKLVLLGVGEGELHTALAGLSRPYRERTVLLQNELLPAVWQSALGPGVPDPTVAVVWFEKKPGKLVHSIRPSVLHGPLSSILAESLQVLNLPFELAGSPEQRDFALVVKNLYILTLNLAGLSVGGAAGELWTAHATLAEPLAHELVSLQAALLGRELAPEPLIQGLREAIACDPAHACRGRTAEQRLSRALRQAESRGLRLPTLEQLGRLHLPAR